MKREIVSIAFVLMLLVSTFSVINMVYAYANPYTYAEYYCMPPDCLGDVNGDGKIDITDAVKAGHAYGSQWPGYGGSGVDWKHWDSRCDMNEDGRVDILDIVTVCGKYGYVDSSSQYVAYSTDYEFTVPDDGDSQVCYHHIVKMYVPKEFDGRSFHFVTDGVDDWILNVMLNGHVKYEGELGDPCQNVNIDLGELTAEMHLLEFDLVEQWAGGKVKFCVAVDGDPAIGKAYLTRFRVYVPNYSDNEYGYSITTHTNFPIDDYYFLNGYADDYIDDLYVDGLKWQDWEWDMGAYGAIYAWGDGFCYPLGERLGWRDMEFAFGEIWHAGLLDFQIVSWTHQRDRIGPPKFYAVGGLNQADYITHSTMFYGGSKWKFEDDPEFSERYFELRQVINARYDDGETWFNASLEIGLGLGWAEWALLPATEDDVGITLNFTATEFLTNRRDHMDMGFYFKLYLDDPTIDIYSFPALEIEGIEYQEHDSFVKPDLTSAIDYTGTVIMFVSSTAGQPIGALTGLAIKGFAAAIRITEGQHVSRFEQIISDAHHYQVLRNYDLSIPSPPQGETRSKSDIIFFKLNPVAGKHCGLTKVVLQGTLEAWQWFIGGPGTGPIPVWGAPIADIEISIYIPWFLRG